MIHAGLLVKTLTVPIPHQRRAKLTGAWVATTPLPPPPSQPRRATGASEPTAPSSWERP
ncbi:integrase catalytic subunit [Streptomyces sp. 769]|nr:integrase catalytic subunit [Streptomyces sp. 769]